MGMLNTLPYLMKLNPYNVSNYTLYINQLNDYDHAEHNLTACLFVHLSYKLLLNIGLVQLSRSESTVGKNR